MEFLIRCSEHLWPERKYVLDILLTERLGVHYTVEYVQDSEYIEIVLSNSHSLSIANPGFASKNDCQWTAADLPRSCQWWEIPVDRDRIPVFFGQAAIDLQDDHIRLEADVISMVFFALSRWEELLDWKRDRWDRILEDQLFLMREGLDEYPIVEIWEGFLRKLISRLGIELPLRREYRVISTHDMDYDLCFGSWSEVGKRTAGDLLKRRDTRSAWWSLTQGTKTQLGGKDPYDRVSYFLEQGRKSELESIFYWIPRQAHILGASYTLDDPKIQRWIQEIASAGASLGIHPSIGSYRDALQMESEMSRMSEYLQQSIRHTRQHFLQFDILETIQILEKYGPLVDSSLHFRENGGLRCGTSIEFPLYHFGERRASTLREQPLLFMDQNLQYTALDKDSYLHRLQRMISRVQSTQGTFCFLWHNSSFGHPIWQNAFIEYEELVKMAKKSS